MMKRFWEKVKRRSPDECWPWMAYIRPDGYGRFRTKVGMMLSHRVSWELTNGPIPHGMYICHSCDTPECCNPDHLFLGTQRDNVRDCMKKGRRYDCRGENNSGAKLTKIDVLAIKHWLKDARWTQKKIAGLFGVCLATINRINTGVSWKNLE